LLLLLLTAAMLWAGRLSWLGWKTWQWIRPHNTSISWQHHSARLLLPAGMWIYICQWLHK